MPLLVTPLLYKNYSAKSHDGIHYNLWRPGVLATLFFVKVTETKIHLDGHREDFLCDSLIWNSQMAVVNFVWARKTPFRDGTIFFPPGIIKTTATFWRDRNFLIYQITLEDGTLLGHRFDICEKVQILDDALTWIDLLVDLWVEPNGILHVLDEDEIANYQSRGLVNERQLEIIQSTKAFLMKNHQQVIAEVSR